ncbi:MAG: leucyl/phenylalanyl-tRNA--protein transferase [Verrucomicrobiota bacterium]
MSSNRQRVEVVPVALGRKLWFPDPESPSIVGAPRGLIALGGDFSVKRLLLAYRMGIFPWSVDPITWWSPETRGIFELESFHVPRSLAKTLRKGVFKVTVNQAFRAVMEGCAARSTTWITKEFLAGYTRLHEEGHAHSVECWQDGELAGGIYGVSAGGLFAGESMFHRVSDASKVALYHLVQRLRERRYELFDIQMLTPVTQQLGAVEIPRSEYLRRLAQAVEKERRFEA